MNEPIQEHRDYGFVAGLFAGTVVGVGLMLWFAPRAVSEIRLRMSDTAKDLARRAADEYDQASTRAGEALDELTRKGQGMRDNVADAVARGAHKVERFAAAAKGEKEADATAAADRKASAPRLG